MSLAYLLAGNRGTGLKQQGEEDFFLEFDLMLGENHDLSSEVTSWPVESGGEVTDHIRNEPEEIEIRGFITNTPNSFDAVAAITQDRAQDAYNKLIELRNARTPIDVLTTLDLYENMAIEKIVFPRSVASVSALYFTMHLKKIAFASTEVTSEATTDQASSEQDAGNQQPQVYEGMIPANI